MTLAAELRSIAAILDVRDAAEDEESESASHGGLGRILSISVLILIGVAAVIWWFLFRTG